MFAKILHANDGSEHAFHALSPALAVAKQDNSELPMVSVEEIDYLPEFIGGMAEESHVKRPTQVVAGHPVRDIVKLAADLNVDLLVIGARGHSALYERMVGSRADRIMQLAQCPVL